MTTTKLKLRVSSGPAFRARVRPGIVGPPGPSGPQGIQGIPGGSVEDGDKGDITVSGTGSVWTIDDDVVTYQKIQNISASARFLGRISGGAGNTEELTGTQATTLLDVFTSGLKGVTPASGGGTSNFLRSDGTWATPPGTGGVTDGDKGDVVVSGSGAIWTIDSGVITLAKMANINTDRLIGRDTAASGVPEEISIGGGIEFTGSLGIQTSAFTGDVTKAAGGTTLTISNDAVSYAKLQNVSATARFIGRITAGAGDAEELTGTQATTLLDDFTSALKGLVPASGGGTTNFLRADGTWTAPTAVVADGDKGDITVSASGATWTVDNTAISYAKIQNVSTTSRVLGRKTAGAGSTEECTLSEVLDFIGSAAQGDILYRGASAWSRLAAGASGLFLKTLGAGANPAWDTPSGAAAPSPPQGRLTLTSVTPVLTSTVSAATTIYYTPYVGQHVPLYDGSSFTMTDTGGEISQATTDNTKSPAACTTNSGYDLFVWNDSGTMRCTRGPAWSSSSARGTGAGTTELIRIKGIWLNANNITNGPNAQRGTYVGTIRTNGSSQVDFILGGSNTKAFLYVWNCYNRIRISARVIESTSSWSYTTNTWRRMNNNGNIQINWIVGLAEDLLDITGHQLMESSATPAVGLALDWSSGAPNTSGLWSLGAAGGAYGSCTSVLQIAASLGVHNAQPLEYGNTGATFYGANTVWNCGISIAILM